MELFLVVLGGRIRGCHIEQHDVRWVVGKGIDDTLPRLREEWIGLRTGLHIDSYKAIRHVDGHRIEVKEQTEIQAVCNEPKLWFVNLGGYTATSMAEQHQFGLVVAKTSQAAKARAKRRWLQNFEQIHKDDLHDLRMDPALDDLLPIEGNGRWVLQLSPSRQDTDDDSPETPDWYGYWKI